MKVLWREGWLKPLSDFEIGSKVCNLCNQVFKDALPNAYEMLKKSREKSKPLFFSK
jgi:hypothetical protein